MKLPLTTPIFSPQVIKQQLLTCMLVDRHFIRRKLRELTEIQALQDEKSVLKAQRLVNEITQK